MAKDIHGIPTYYGRSDISRFLANVPLQAISWKEYTVSGRETFGEGSPMELKHDELPNQSV